jgi:hypothetical protein
MKLFTTEPQRHGERRNKEEAFRSQRQRRTLSGVHVSASVTSAASVACLKEDAAASACATAVLVFFSVSLCLCGEKRIDGATNE